MEWQFRINWPAIVEEAKQRRKTQKLTQQQLAILAGVSTPTVSRFENGEKDVQLSSIMNILGILGMVDKRVLLFSITEEPEPEFSKKTMRFTGKDGNTTVICQISYEALADHFKPHSNKGQRAPLDIFIANRERIEAEARRKYLANQLEADGSVFIRTTDLYR